MKKLFILLPLMALLLGCSSDEKGAQCPVLTVEGGQIQGVPVSYTHLTLPTKA